MVCRGVSDYLGAGLREEISQHLESKEHITYDDLGLGLGGK